MNLQKASVPVNKKGWHEDIMEQAQKKRYAKAALFGLALFLLWAAVTANKRNFNVDEVYTYGLANHADGRTVMSVRNAPYVYEPAGEAFREYMAVQEGRRFNFRNVWELNEKDVHPPFYYVLIHMISSVFAGSASKWIGASVNLLFMLLTFWMVRKILCLFGCGEKEKDAIGCFLILSAGMLHSLAFLRMYVMVMFLVTLCTYWILRFIHAGRSSGFYVGIGVIALVGALTHYYFLIYLFFISIFFGIYLLCNKKIADAVKYVLTMLAAGAGSCCVFPAMLKHIFGGYRGEQSFENLKQGFGSYLVRLKACWTFIDQDLFGGCVPVVLCVCVFLFVIRTRRQKEWEEEEEQKPEQKQLNTAKAKKWMWLCMGGACVCYFVLVAKIAVYVTQRYFYPIYAVALILVTLGLKKFFDFIAGETPRVSVTFWAIALGIMTAGGYKAASWEFLYLDSAPLLEKAEAHKDASCLYVYKEGSEWKLHTSYLEVQNYARAAFFENDIEKLAQMPDLCKESEYVLFIADCDAEKALSRIMELCPQINAYDKLGGFGYAVSYHLYGRDIVAQNGYFLNGDQTLFMDCDAETGNIYLSEVGTQIMALKSVDADYYTLYLEDGVADVESGVMEEGRNIWKFQPNGTDAQKWSLAENADGTVVIYAYQSDYCLTWDDTGNIFISAYNPDEARQKWRFILKD